MTQQKSIIFKAITVTGIILFITGCADSFLIQKSDISKLNHKFSLIEERLDNQSSKTETLIELHKHQEVLLSKTIEQNYQHFKNIEEQITASQSFTAKKLQAIEKTANNYQIKEKPEKDSRVQNLPLKISATHKLLIGRIEKVRLNPPDRVFHARIDTGATTSSLDAQDIETFERDGDSWVRFKIKDPAEDAFYEVEKPIVRKVRIKQASTDETNIRPVIELQFQIGDIKRIEEFTLEDRAHLDFQLLIGRNILRDLMVVDVSQKFIIPLPAENENGSQNQ